MFLQTYLFFIGMKMPKYCLFGDTINTASRMQSNGEAGKIHISNKSKDLLELFGDFIILPRGEIQIKGKGGMKTFWLDCATKPKETKRTRRQASKQGNLEANTAASSIINQTNQTNLKSKQNSIEQKNSTIKTESDTAADKKQPAKPANQSKPNDKTEDKSKN